MCVRNYIVDLLAKTPMLDTLYGEYEEFLHAADYLMENGVTVVVRCKDCIHWSRTYEEYERCKKKRYVYSDMLYCTSENDFCSLGKRKNDGKSL